MHSAFLSGYFGLRKQNFSVSTERVQNFSEQNNIFPTFSFSHSPNYSTLKPDILMTFPHKCNTIVTSKPKGQLKNEGNV